MKQNAIRSLNRTFVLRTPERKNPIRRDKNSGRTHTILPISDCELVTQDTILESVQNRTDTQNRSRYKDGKPGHRWMP
jgi:hypothetical protein